MQDLRHLAAESIGVRGRRHDEARQLRGHLHWALPLHQSALVLAHPHPRARQIQHGPVGEQGQTDWRLGRDEPARTDLPPRVTPTRRAVSKPKSQRCATPPATAPIPRPEALPNLTSSQRKLSGQRASLDAQAQTSFDMASGPLTSSPVIGITEYVDPVTRQALTPAGMFRRGWVLAHGLRITWPIRSRKFGTD